MNFHELKDIVMIYSSHDGKPDYTWDKAKITVWNPFEQKEMQLCFTGSSKGDKPEDYKIHFNVIYKDEGHEDVFDAYKNALKRIFQNIDDEQLNAYGGVFCEELLKTRK